MTIEEIWGIINPAWKDIGIIVIILSLVQISPLKLNPWSWLKAFTEMPKRIKAIEGRIETLEGKVTGLEEKDEENMALSARIRILRFADELEMGMPKSGESFREVMRDIDRYRRYCTDHPKFSNSGAVSSITFIEQRNHERRKQKAEDNEKHGDNE